jgi:hypothetical protein
VSRTAVVFVDPGGTKGAGVGSGGADLTLGVVAFSRSFGAMRISCTLPPPLSDICAGVVTANLTMST